MSDPETEELNAKLDRELDRVNTTPVTIIYSVGLLSFMGGAGYIFIEGVDLVSGVATLFGGIAVYKWHESDKYQKSLRERLRKKRS